MKHEELVHSLKSLHLTAISRDYANLARQCEEARRTYEQYLAALTQTEITHRKRVKVNRLIREAKFPILKTLDTYDYTHITGVTPQQINRLAGGDFVKSAANIVFYGDFGVGKSHLATGIAVALCEIGIKCLFSSTQSMITSLEEAQKTLTLASLFKKLDRFDVIVLDELGYTPQSKDGADLFFQLISQRYERKSLIITTNLPYSSWDSVFLNSTTTAAAVDRIIHNCETFNIHGVSYRAEAAKKRQAKG